MHSTTASFSFQSSKIFLFFLLPLLFIPKINLISLGGEETAGIRIDDIILFGFGLILMWSTFAIRRGLLRIEALMVMVILCSILSFSINRLLVKAEILQVNASIFYAVRPFEYFLFFYLGIHLAPLISLDTVIKALFTWNGIVMLLQKARVIGGFTNTGYLSVMQDRIIGICAFPSETGAFLNLLFCYLLFASKPSPGLVYFLPKSFRKSFKETYPYWLCLVTAYLIILTGSRAALAVLFFIFMFKIATDLRNGTPREKLYAVSFLSLGCTLGAIGIMSSQSLYERSHGLLSWQNIDLVSVVWDEIELDYNPIGNEIVSLSDDYDMSWWLRIHKWCYVFKLYLLNPICYLFGIGPGFAFSGLDGGYLRILVELGLVGTVLYYLFFREMIKASLSARWMLLAFGVNMIFFDAHIAYKVMALLFFVVGWEFGISKEKLSPFANGGNNAL